MWKRLYLEHLNPSTCDCENDEYLGSVINDSLGNVMKFRGNKKYRNEFFWWKNCKQNREFLYFTCFLLITISLLIIVGDYCYQSKQKQILPYYNSII